MKFTISKAKPKTKSKPKTQRRLSDKEIALRWLDEQLQIIVKRSAEMTTENLREGYADGRKIKESHIEKMQLLVKNRVERYRAPILTLFTKRDIETVNPL